jgi:hypothetical protein
VFGLVLRSTELEGLDLQNFTEAYLDIETTGLSPDHNEITVVGIFVTGRNKDWFIQFIGNDITAMLFWTPCKGSTGYILTTVVVSICHLFIFGTDSTLKLNSIIMI